MDQPRGHAPYQPPIDYYYLGTGKVRERRIKFLTEKHPAIDFIDGYQWHPHPCGAYERHLAVRRIVHLIRQSYRVAGCDGDPSGGHEFRWIQDIGSNVKRNRDNGWNFIHGCCPELSPKDISRNERYRSLSGWCKHKYEECDCVQPVARMAIQSIYYLGGPREIAKRVQETELWSYHLLFKDVHGLLFGGDAEYVLRPGGKVVMNSNRNSDAHDVSYEHDACHWLEGNYWSDGEIAMCWENQPFGDGYIACFRKAPTHMVSARSVTITKALHQPSHNKIDMDAWKADAKATPQLDMVLTDIDSAETWGPLLYLHGRKGEVLVSKKLVNDIALKCMYRERDPQLFRECVDMARRALHLQNIDAQIGHDTIIYGVPLAFHLTLKTEVAVSRSLIGNLFRDKLRLYAVLSSHLKFKAHPLPWLPFFILFALVFWLHLKTTAARPVLDFIEHTTLGAFLLAPGLWSLICVAWGFWYLRHHWDFMQAFRSPPALFRHIKIPNGFYVPPPPVWQSLRFPTLCTPQRRWVIRIPSWFLKPIDPSEETGEGKGLRVEPSLIPEEKPEIAGVSFGVRVRGITPGMVTLSDHNVANAVHHRLMQDAPFGSQTTFSRLAEMALLDCPKIESHVVGHDEESIISTWVLRFKAVPRQFREYAAAAKDYLSGYVTDRVGGFLFAKKEFNVTQPEAKPKGRHIASMSTPHGIATLPPEGARIVLLDEVLHEAYGHDNELMLASDNKAFFGSKLTPQELGGFGTLCEEEGYALFWQWDIACADGSHGVMATQFRKILLTVAGMRHDLLRRYEMRRQMSLKTRAKSVIFSLGTFVRDLGSHLKRFRQSVLPSGVPDTAQEHKHLGALLIRLFFIALRRRSATICNGDDAASGSADYTLPENGGYTIEELERLAIRVFASAGLRLTLRITRNMDDMEFCSSVFVPCTWSVPVRAFGVVSRHVLHTLPGRWLVRHSYVDRGVDTRSIMMGGLREYLKAFNHLPPLSLIAATELLRLHVDTKEVSDETLPRKYQMLKSKGIPIGNDATYLWWLVRYGFAIDVYYSELVEELDACLTNTDPDAWGELGGRSVDIVLRDCPKLRRHGDIVIVDESRPVNEWKCSEADVIDLDRWDEMCQERLGYDIITKRPSPAFDFMESFDDPELAGVKLTTWRHGYERVPDAVTIDDISGSVLNL